MKKKEIIVIASLMIACTAPVSQTGASILYKKYVVASYGGSEILCEPYTIKKDDSVIRLLREKGDISANDFPEFLSIFKSLNPKISDINLIRQNDEIFIPLKKLSPDSLPGQSSGVVSIPFVSVSSFGEMLEQHTEEYTVRQGDSLSSIVDNFFEPESGDDKKKGIELFRLLNPDVSDINQIGAGSRLTVARKSIRSQPWYREMYDSRGKPNPAKILTIQKKEDMPPVTNPGPMAASPRPMEKFASLVDGKIYKTGEYYIPKPGGNVHKIDLSRDPMLDIEGGGRVLFCSDYEKMSDSVRAAIKKAMPDTSVIDGKNTSTVDGIIDSMVSASVLRKPPAPIILGSPDAMIEITPEWLFVPGRKDSGKKIFVTSVEEDSKKSHAFFIDYLKHARGVLLKELGTSASSKKDIRKDYFIDETETVNFSRQNQLYINLAVAIGYSYSEKAGHSVSTPGGVLDINADTIYSSGGQIFILADKGLSINDISYLRDSGIKVIEFSDQQNSSETDYSESTVSGFLETLGCRTEINPSLKILSSRTGDPYITIKPSGIYAKTPDNSEFVITKGLFSSPVTASLQHAGIKTVRLAFNSYY